MMMGVGYVLYLGSTRTTVVKFACIWMFVQGIQGYWSRPNPLPCVFPRIHVSKMMLL